VALPSLVFEGPFPKTVTRRRAMSKSVVCCVRVRPETILQDYERLAHLARLGRWLAPGAATLLREDRARTPAAPGLVTPPWQLEGAAVALRAEGLEELARVHGRDPREIAADPRARRAFRHITERHGIRPLETRGPDAARWIEYRPRANMRVLHTLFDDGVFVPSTFFGTNVVHLPVARPPRAQRLWGAIGSAVFGLLGPASGRAVAAGPHAIVDVLAIEREVHAGRFAFADATTVVPERAGAAQDPLAANLVFASSDPVALDATIARLFAIEPLSLVALSLAQDAGLGTADPRHIELVGDDPSGPPWRPAADPSAPLAERVQQKLRATLTAPDVAPALGLAAASIHYALLSSPIGRSQATSAFERWRDRSPWGRLDEAYAAGEHARFTGRPSIAPILR
jgi:hypothetical protein